FPNYLPKAWIELELLKYRSTISTYCKIYIVLRASLIVNISNLIVNCGFDCFKRNGNSAGADYWAGKMPAGSQNDAGDLEMESSSWR
ncbi:hypothetical protein, partial [Caulobacter sp. HMWF009]|uniref:hypothetical protein n=1 Tax=Caulobacter sp. HMWF009 TaxID=2056846 RepID=UPI001E47DB53